MPGRLLSDRVSGYLLSATEADGGLTFLWKDLRVQWPVS